FFGLAGGTTASADVVFSTTPSSADVRKRSSAVSHGAFDNDPDTMESVARSILGSETLKAPFPRSTRDFFAEELLNLNIPAVPSSSTVPMQPQPFQMPGPPPVLQPSKNCRKRALCIGINAYRAQYALNGCVADARNWGAALEKLGYEVTYIFDAMATRSAILAAVERLVRECRAGDLAVFQFAGHGTTLRDVNSDETDAWDEALCPVDMASGAFVIDDDLRRIFDGLPERALLTCFIDCCHSGTITRVFAGLSEANASASTSKARFVPFSSELQAAHESFRQALGSRAAAPPLRGPDRMREVLFSACLPSEVAYETAGNGDFTSRAVPLLLDSAGKLTNAEFQERITRSFGSPARQHPNLDCSQPMASQPLLKVLEGPVG
ncbi:MAG TPA: caspase family protein, partial [Bryobacteraceae bacterium]|nr:caspase family protein [Bryobacteraceae bacterium]